MLGERFARLGSVRKGRTFVVHLLQRRTTSNRTTQSEHASGLEVLAPLSRRRMHMTAYVVPPVLMGVRGNYRLGEVPKISQGEGLRWRAVVQHDRRTRYSQRQAKTARYQPIDK